MTSLLQKINTLDTKVDGLDSSNLQTQITTNTTDISTLQTSKQNTLIAGDNITITGDTISSSGGGTTSGTAETLGDQVFYAVSSVSSVIGSGTSYISSFDTIQKTNTELYTHTNDIITVLKSGYYKVEFNCNFRNFGYSDRAVIRTTVLINNVKDITSGGQSTCYTRDNSFGARGTNNNSLFFNLNANDTIRLENTLNKAQSTGFISDFSSFEFSNGSNILISRLDVTAVTSDGTFLQGKLTAGNNITIEGDVISATGGGGGTTIDSTTDLSCNTLTTVGDVNIGGQITSPNQISFRARRQGNIIINTRVNLPYNVAMFNIGGAYNITTYEFTAPISGTYFLNGSFFTDNNNNYMVDIKQRTPTIDIEQERIEQLTTGSGGLTKKIGSVTFFLNEGDVVYTEWRAGRVRLSDGGNGAALINFGGYYLG